MMPLHRACFSNRCLKGLLSVDWLLVHERRMGSSRLSDSQKQELVARYRSGERATALAQAYGCSANTISRVVKSVLDPEELATLKKQSRGRGAAQVELPGAAGQEVLVLDGTAMTTMDTRATESQPDPLPEAVETLVPEPHPVPTPADSLLDASLPEEEALIIDAPPSSLAIDDADDFGVDTDELDDVDDVADIDDDSDSDEDGDDVEDSDAAGVGVTPAAAGLIDLSSGPAFSSGSPVPIQPLPLAAAALPTSLYLLVDKTVELEARPLREFSELGPLPQEEQDRQALMLYVNPRQAKRQCGRSQRVIKLPDSTVLQRTAPYLVAQGITRLVLEGGSLFAVPGT